MTFGWRLVLIKGVSELRGLNALSALRLPCRFRGDDYMIRTDWSSVWSLRYAPDASLGIYM